MSESPLILTLTLDAVSQQFFNDLRKKHFPVERNYLDAHLTLFHHLPPSEPQILNDIKLLVNRNSPLLLQVSAIKSIGNGVAYQLECTMLMQLHKLLQQRWLPWLKPQDQQKLWPHITVQNKASPDSARALKLILEQSFTPFEVTGNGLSLFEYKNGPWEFVEKFDFANKIG